MVVQTQSTYRDQLLRMTRALAHANSDAIAADLSHDSTPAAVKMFVDGNLDKRFEKLMNGLEFIAPAFRRFDNLVEAYVRESTLTAYDSGVSDCDRMLAWLEQMRRLSPRQLDYIACQRARHQVEALAREHRLEYVRFHERWSVTQTLVEQLPAGMAILYLNPIRVWTTIGAAELLGEEVDRTTRVVFFPVAGEISTAALDDRGSALLAELVALGPAPYLSWAATSKVAQDEDLLDIVRDLAAMGLVAVA